MEKETKISGVHTMGRCTIIIGYEGGRWHLSISTKYAQPSYKEIKEARYRFIPDHVTMAQLFPSQAEFVNLHPFCHHLWQVPDDIEESCVHPFSKVVSVGGKHTCFKCGHDIYPD